MGKTQYYSKPRSRLGAPKPRKCLKCGEQFMSQHSGERICRRCKGTAEWREGESWLERVG